MVNTTVIEKYLYLIMPNDQPEPSDIIPEPAEQLRFPYLHLFAGLVLSAISFVVLTPLWANIILNVEAFRVSSLLPPVVMAYFVPELLIVSTLIYLARRPQASDYLNYRSSYIAMIVINLLCFCFICSVMNSVHC